MHCIETIIQNNQKAGRTIASQAERIERIKAAAWTVVNSKLLDEQQKAIYSLRDALVADDAAKAVSVASAIAGAA